MPKKRSDIPKENSSAADPGAEPKKPRRGFYVPTDENGAIDEARIKPDDKEKLNQIIATRPESPASALVIDRDSVVILYDAVAMSLQTVGKTFFKWPRDLTRLLVYSDEQKEKLKDPTAKVIERYAPAWLLKHQELVALGMIFSSVTKEMVENAVTQYSILHAGEIQAAAENREAAKQAASQGIAEGAAA